MKQFFLAIACAVASLGNAQDSTKNGDGPYVFYTDEGIEAVTIENGVAQTKKIDPRGDRAINIAFPGHTDWNFSVTLRHKLANEPSNYSQPSKLFAISDIEGEFEAFRSLLINNKIVDDQYHWIFGEGSLVICGDLFDRGKEVVQELWLLYKLEDEARAAHGYVHTILGNHDIMNLSGDTRYVEPFYFADAAVMGKKYGDLYSKKTELGRWLRTKNIVERIGDNLCLHAGVSPIINSLVSSLNQAPEMINSLCRPYYDRAQEDEVIVAAGVYPYFGENGLFWFRGYFTGQRETMRGVDSTLIGFHCRRIIVGHTILTRNPAMYYGGKVIGIDVNEHQGDRAGILYIDKKWWRTDGDGNQIELVYRPNNDQIGQGQAN